MKEFSLEEYLKNPDREVVTRDGRKVTRFLCTDAKITFPLIALVEATPGSTKECLRTYTKDGNFFVDQISPNDLFFAPSKHTDYINLYRDESVYFLGAVYTSEEYAKNIAKGNDQYITTIKIECEE